MKNNVLKVLLATMVIGAILVGCGENTSEDTQKNEFSQQSEVKNETEQKETEKDVEASEQESETTQQNSEVQEEKVVTFTDILLNPTENGKYYPKSADYNDIWFATADVDGDGDVELFIGDQYEEGMQQVGRIYNILALENGKIKDLNGKWVYGRTAMFTLYDNGILYDGFDDGSGFGWYANLKTGEFYEGEIPDDVFATMAQSKEIPLVWYQATAENVNSVLGGK